jgi:type I restriction enzyme S subunit
LSSIWRLRPLGEVCTLQRGFDLPTGNRREGPVPLVSSSGVIDRHDQVAVAGPGVVTGRSGSIGNVFFIEEDFWPLNTTLFVKDFQGNDPRFIHYLLTLIDLRSLAGGAGVPTLNRNAVHAELVRCPDSCGEQRRIVTILDETFEGIATAKAHAEQNLRNVSELIEELNQGLFSNDHAEPTGGASLETLCELIVDCEHKTAPTQSEGVPSIRTPNIGRGRLLLDGVYRVSEDTYRDWTRRAEPRGGDLILAREAPAGNVAVIPDGMRVCLGQRTVLIRPRPALLVPEYLAHLLLRQNVQRRLLAHSRGATVQHVNLKDIRALQIGELPTLNEQRRVIDLINEHLYAEDRLLAIYQRKLTALTELQQSLLHQAFTGQF